MRITPAYSELKEAFWQLSMRETAVGLNAGTLLDLKASDLTPEDMEVALKDYHESLIDYREAQARVNDLLIEIENKTGYTEAYPDV